MTAISLEHQVGSEIVRLVAEGDRPDASLAKSMAQSLLSERAANAVLRTELEQLKQYALDLQKALTDLSGGGSENFVRRGEEFRADIPFCVERVRRRFETGLEFAKSEKQRATAAEARSAHLEQQVKTLREALEPFGPIHSGFEEILWGHYPDTEPAQITVPLGRLRRAARALAETTNGERDDG